ncbi:Glutathione S-transferase, C-terminal-like,Glutathione S-transferase, N-terminal,Glutathione S- [Cinara cedri]|uniref:glutathione transferase n=1 Tax=Cinara cedri TaxID=506608 RepID=A0A5E4NPG8_9HEMI|nr:Glutathione S-transferase, C-terminal-like,Glutathione S-transferase, N-terminal,Glutathione S- [Cinara cedri]
MYLPFEHNPVLIINEEIRITQSLAICRYLSSLSNLNGNNDWEAYLIDSYVESMYDLKREFIKYDDAAAKAKMELKNQFTDIQLPNFLKKFNNIVAKNNNNNLFVNNKVTWADIYFSKIVESITMIMNIDLYQYTHLPLITKKVYAYELERLQSHETFELTDETKFEVLSNEQNEDVTKPIRFLLNDMQRSFNESFYDDFAWDFNLQKSRQYANTPVLIIDYEIKINQSPVICRFLAAHSSLKVNNDWEAYLIDSHVDSMLDLRREIIKIIKINDENDEKIALKSKERFLQTQLPNFLKKFNNIVAFNGNYFVNGKFTWADVFFAGIINFLHHFTEFDASLKGYENLSTLVKRVRNIDLSLQHNYDYKTNGEITIIEAFELTRTTKIEILSINAITADMPQPIKYLLNSLVFSFDETIYDNKELWNDSITKGMPFGQTLVFIINKQMRITQPIAICRYLASLSTLNGANDWEAYLIDSLVESMNDLKREFIKHISKDDDKTSMKLAQEFIEIQLPCFLNKFHNIVAHNNEFFVNGKLTWADVYFAELVNHIALCTGDDKYHT